MNRGELSSGEYNKYYQPYIDMVGDNDVFDYLRNSHETTLAFFYRIKKEKFDFRYAENKWTIKEILQHLIDSERVFTYRAMCIARNDKTELPGFDQDAFVAESLAEKRSLESLLLEYKSMRMATVSLFESFDYTNLTRLSVISGCDLSVRAIAFIIVGHEKHHIQIIKERYL